MIISHKHKYLFVELPRTASTAISKELRQHYAGRPVLSKHATYYDFLRKATDEEKRYFVFSCIRNPLDDTVSQYFKYKTNHREHITDARKVQRKRPSVKWMDYLIYHYIRQTNADFSTFVRTFYRIPYNNWSHLSHDQFDFVIRFEQLAVDFERVLRLLHIEPVRPLPVINQTGARDRNYHTYYDERAQHHAKYIFGPFMKKWGYAFPAEWGDVAISRRNTLEFQFYNVFRNVYWKYMKSFV